MPWKGGCKGEKQDWRNSDGFPPCVSFLRFPKRKLYCQPISQNRLTNLPPKLILNLEIGAFLILFCPKKREVHIMQKISTKTIVMTGMMTAVLAVLSQIQIPMPSGVPVTMQTFGVALCACVLGWKMGTASVAVYLLLGSFGVPVFAGLSGVPDAGIRSLPSERCDLRCGSLRCRCGSQESSERSQYPDLCIKNSNVSGFIICSAFHCFAARATATAFQKIWRRKLPG